MTFLYRLNGGEVIGASVDVSGFGGIDATYFGTVTDPALSNGADLSVPKIYDGSVLRNATAGEISAFAVAATNDTIFQQRTRAIARFNGDADFRKILRAIVGLTVSELNLIRAKTSNTANPAQPMPARTEAQVQTSIVNAINAGTYD